MVRSRPRSPAPSPVGAAAGWGALAVIIALALLGMTRLQPPEAVAANAPPHEFSAARALTHLRAVARKPHPAGTTEHDDVHRYILRELAALGLDPQVQQTTALVPSRGGLIRAATVRNVMARLPGTARRSGGRDGGMTAVMLSSHYDSVATSDGATDDGAGVGAMLETLRALRAGAPLKNDLLFLFTDAEEYGLLGAHAFVDEAHPQFRDVGLVLNFEGRGHTGPSFMFETSDGNGRLIEEFARAAPYPVANSLMYSLYKRLPNDTDLTVFKRAGRAGLNFAYAGGVTHYHTPLDNIEELDERSLQHHGSYALALARHFGDLEASDVKTRDRVYFNAFGYVLIHYSEAWVVPLTLLIAVMFAGVMALGFRRQQLSVYGILVGAAALFVSVAGAGAAAPLVWRGVRKLHRGHQFLPWDTPYNEHFYLWGLLCLGLAVTAAVYAFAARKTTVPNLMAGALWWWLILLVLATVALPAGTYLFAWPLFFALLGCALMFIFGSGGNAAAAATKNSIVGALCAIPGVVLIAPLLSMLFVMVGLGMAALLVVLFVLLLGLLIPPLSFLWGAPRRRWMLPAVSALAAGGLISVGLATAGFDAKHRHANSLFYVLNADSGEAVWASTDARLDDWTAQFIPNGSRRASLGAVFPWVAQSVWQSAAAAPLAPLTPPRLEVLADEREGGTRTLRLRIASPRGAPLLLCSAVAGTNILGGAVNQKPFSGAAATADTSFVNSWKLFYAAAPAEGIELVLKVERSQPVKLSLQDVSYDLPALTDRAHPGRPSHMMKAPSFATSDTTVVSKLYVIE